MLDVPSLLLAYRLTWSVVWVKWKGAWGTWSTPAQVWLQIWTLHPTGRKFGECCTMLKRASTWPSHGIRSKYVHISSSTLMGGASIPEVDHHKHLRIYFNKSLTWTDHGHQWSFLVFIVCSIGAYASYGACEGNFQTLLYENVTLFLLFYPTHSWVHVSCVVRRHDG